jgi:hypothetical protein
MARWKRKDEEMGEAVERSEFSESDLPNVDLVANETQEQVGDGGASGGGRIRELEAALEETAKELWEWHERAEKAEAERDAIEAKTIDRCAQVVDKINWIEGVDGSATDALMHAVGVIRALKPSEERVC